MKEESIINPEWEKLKNEYHLVPLFCLPNNYEEINIGPEPKKILTDESNTET